MTERSGSWPLAGIVDARVSDVSSFASRATASFPLPGSVDGVAGLADVNGIATPATGLLLK